MTTSSDTSGPKERERGRLARYFARFDDGELVRWAFRGLLVGAVAVLALDLGDMVERSGGLWPGQASLKEAVPEATPVLPPAVMTEGTRERSVDPREHVTSDESELRRPMRFTLLAEGVMLAEGSIQQGSAARFAAEIEERGEYVRTLRLDSPGGSLEDAMAMARLVRERGYTTEVADGSICASSCPLLFAGGKTRIAGEKAAIGLHQFYAASGSASEPAQVMSDAQITTARISRHLAEMGVDPALWLHALDTPPRQLYYLSHDETARYRLVTLAGSLASR